MIADLQSSPLKKRSWRTPPTARELAIRKERLLASRRTAHKNARRRICGIREVGWEIVSDDQMALAEKYFWGKRGMKRPTTDCGGIVPSVSDFEEEAGILLRGGKMRYGHAETI